MPKWTPEARREWARKRYADNPAANAKAKEWAQSRRDKKIGWTKERFAVLIEAQESKCAICSCTFTSTQKGPGLPCRDHCHATGKPRGILCRVCNVALGFYEGHQRSSGLTVEAYDRYLAKY